VGVHARHGWSFYRDDLELVGSGGGKILRIYIDRKDSSGVSLEDCSTFSNAFSELLDQEENDVIEGNFYLEVSSPGVERSLKKDWHYVESVGQTVFVNLNQPLEKFTPGLEGSWANRKKLTGLVKSVQNENLELETEGKQITVPLQYVMKAHVVFDFSKKQEKQ
jgi:ribosome maturation factor RimP